MLVYAKKLSDPKRRVNSKIAEITRLTLEEKNARETAGQEILIARKLKRCSTICQCRFVEPTLSRARARKNYQRLFYRYPEIAERLGLHEWLAI